MTFWICMFIVWVLLGEFIGYSWSTVIVGAYL